MAYVVCAKWTAKEGESEKVAEAIRKFAPLSRQESGVLLYQPHRSREDRNVFFFYEQYVDAYAYEPTLTPSMSSSTDSATRARASMLGRAPSTRRWTSRNWPDVIGRAGSYGSSPL